jgi:hypothetical protein
MILGTLGVRHRPASSEFDRKTACVHIAKGLEAPYFHLLFLTFASRAGGFPRRGLYYICPFGFFSSSASGPAGFRLGMGTIAFLIPLGFLKHDL